MPCHMTRGLTYNDTPKESRHDCIIGKCAHLFAEELKFPQQFLCLVTMFE